MKMSNVKCQMCSGSERLSNVKCQRSNVNTGFTLLEFMIYFALLLVVFLSALGIFNVAMNIRARQVARSEVLRNLDFAVERVTYLGLHADSFGDCPHPSSTICSLTSTQVDFITDGVTSSVFLQSSVLKFQETPTSTPEDLTTSQVSVSPSDSELFRVVGNTLQMKIKMDYQHGQNPLYKYSASTQTTISLR